MTEPMQVNGQLLAADLDNRELEYLILPYGEAGSTNMGRVTASAGALDLPSDITRITFNEEHDYTKPVGRATAVTETPEGLRARFRVAKTSRGDDLLIEAAEGLRTGASVEIANPIVRNGRLMGGLLDAVAAVVKPAYPSAQLVAADCGEITTTQGGTMADQAPQATAPVAPTTATAPVAQAATAVTDPPAPTPTEDDDATQQAQKAQEASPAMAAAQAPAGVQAPRMQATERPQTLQSVAELLASIAQTDGHRSSRLMAALSNVTTATTLAITTPESFEGKVWQGREYQRKYIPLTESEALTKLKYKGWAWKAGKKPVMAAYTGFPNQPPSGPVEMEEREFEPSSYAGAWSMDRKHRDFTDPDYWSEFFIAVATSYAEESDKAHLTALLTGATVVSLVAGDKPTDVPVGLWKVIKGIRTVLPKGMPSFAVLDFDEWEEIIYTPQDKVLPYLQLAMGVEEGQALNFKLLPSTDITTAKTLVGVKQAAKHRELPGASPIRVDSEVIAKGGIEQGVFAYAGTSIREPLALALVDHAATP